MELGGDRLTFGYQRLGDVVRATKISSNGVDAVQNWLDELGDRRWREYGVLGALALVVPEEHGVELFELAVDAEGRVSREIVDGFLESLALRSPANVTDRAVEFVDRLLADPLNNVAVWDPLLRIACIPIHPLNAEWLSTHLAGLSLVQRDASWSNWLVGACDPDEQSSVRRLVEWIWPDYQLTRQAVPDDTALLMTQVLGWFLTTPDRRVRDRATKALVALADSAPDGFAEGVASFMGTNDPYVVERLSAAACGAVLRTDQPDRAATIADGVAALLADGTLEHLLTRDYARKVYESAEEHGWTRPVAGPSALPVWPVPTRSIEEIGALAGPPDYSYSTIWSPLSDMGEFSRHVLQAALRDVYTDDSQTLKDELGRAIFDRVLDLGWTPELFRDIDKRRSGESAAVVERIGTKYLWIAFYEILGRISDHFPIGQFGSNTPPTPYNYAEQLVYRDIDPSVLARKPTQASTEPLWFVPTAAELPDVIVTTFPADMTGVPDPIDLLAIADDEDFDWLVLVSTRRWGQPLSPEVQALDNPQLIVWMHLHAYLAPLDTADELGEWANGKDWDGRWMPDTIDVHNLLLGEHPDAPTWDAASGIVEPLEYRSHDPPPVNLQQSAVWYAGVDSHLDASAEPAHGYAPTRPLFDALGLTKGRDFRWEDSAGLAVQDPAVLQGGPGALVMRRDLVKRLHAEGMTLFWTVLAGYELSPGMLDSVEDDDYRWVSASASYTLKDDRIECNHALAARYQPGPTVEYQIDWKPRSTDP